MQTSASDSISSSSQKAYVIKTEVAGWARGTFSVIVLAHLSSELVTLGLLFVGLLGAACSYSNGIDDYCPPGVPICVRSSSGEGEACNGDWDCLDDLICSAGACEARGESGDACFQWRDESSCAEGLLCNFTDCLPCDYGHCQAETKGVCVSPETLDIGETCCNDRVCTTGACNFALDYTCQEKGTVGDLCTESADCAEGLTCNRTFAQPICYPLGTLGEPCDSIPDCAEPLVCEDQFCSAPPSIGEPCNPLHIFECGRELHCDIVESICVEPGRLGEACVDSYACDAGLVCNRGLHVLYCEKPHVHDLGEPCSRDDNCREGMICGRGSCNNPGYLDEGEQCSDDIECGQGLRCGECG